MIGIGKYSRLWSPSIYAQLISPLSYYNFWSINQTNSRNSNLLPGYTEEIEKLLSRCDRNLDSLSVNDKAVRVRNLAANIQDQAYWFFNNEYMKRDKRLLNLVSSVEREYHKMNSKNTLLYLSALSFFKLNNYEFWDRISEDFLDGKIIVNSYNDWLTLLNFYQKSKYSHLEVLQKLEEIWLFKNKKKPLSLHISEFWAFSTLEYFKESREYIDSFEEKLLSNIVVKPLTLRETAQTLYTYSIINEDLNFDILASLIKGIIDMEDIFPETIDNQLPVPENLYHNLNVISSALVKLNIRNEKIFTMIATRIMWDATHYSESQIKQIEILQLFTSFTRIEYFNFGVLKKLEKLFLQNIEETSANILARMILSHQRWSKFIAHNTIVNRAPRSYFKSFKRYHTLFIKTLLEEILKRGVDKLSYSNLFLLLRMASIKHLKNRNNSRLIFQIGLKGIDNLFDHIEYLENDDEKQVDIFAYWSELSKTTLNKEMEKQVKDKFLEKGFDLDKLMERIERIQILERIQEMETNDENQDIE